MYFENELKDIKRHQQRQACLVLLTMIGTLSVGSFFGLVVFPSWGVFFFAAGFLGFLSTCFVCDYGLKKWHIECPFCQHKSNTTQSTDFVLRTKSCPSCERRIVKEGKQIAKAVVLRLNRRQGKSLMAVWFWIPVIGSLAVLVAGFIRPEIFEGSARSALIFPFLSCTSIWAYVRTLDKRFLPTAVLASVLLPIALSVSMKI